MIVFRCFVLVSLGCESPALACEFRTGSCHSVGVSPSFSCINLLTVLITMDGSTSAVMIGGLFEYGALMV